ncbi:tyrosine-protein kinase family protein [Cryobacterium sp. TMS1-13-1]|uniref:tyrosine-protein kinase family protein n=1 Tax=Cryobacterium sp. TMS1-13-1 TaxID=1259220 RepID=UPI00106AF0E0|nr:tyrosine-protein kinase family protein [Cryobacterium sp. TMS1-13-1]
MSANLDIALSDAEARVLFVDATLRRPKIPEYMNVEGAVGLTNVLIGRAELADVIQPWGRGQLFALPAGRIAPNPSELFGSAGMAKLIQEFNRTLAASSTSVSTPLTRPALRHPPTPDVYVTAVTPTALAGNIAASASADNKLWLWIGDLTLRSTDAGHTWL